MTHLEALLERAAEAQPITFDSNDVRRRVRGRRRTRRIGSGFVAVAVLAGVFALAHENGQGRVDRLASTVRPSLVGAWTPESINGMSLQDRRRVLLEQLDGEIERQSRLVASSKPNSAVRVAATNVLTELYSRRADLLTQRQDALELRRDGTFRGYDSMCGAMAGHWSVDGNRLIVDMAMGDLCTQPRSPTPLSVVLRANPTVKSGAEQGTLALRSPEGDATIRRES
jgi:hypothetical protein